MGFPEASPSAGDVPAGGAVTAEDPRRSGFIPQKQPGLYAVRLQVAGGSLGADQLVRLAELVRRYGSGLVHLTARQGVELLDIPSEQCPALSAELKRSGLSVGVRGNRVRTVTACSAERCRFGLIRAQGLAAAIDAHFYGRGGLPHKFKIGVTGCPNACLKPRENDLGIQGVVRVRLAPDRCTGCGACVRACPAGALKLAEGIAVIDRRRCLGCSRCVRVCAQSAWQQAEVGFRVFAGGKMGKFPRLGRVVFPFVTGEESVLTVIDATLSFYASEGKPQERFADTIRRVGWDRYRAYVRERLSAPALRPAQGRLSSTLRPRPEGSSSKPAAAGPVASRNLTMKSATLRRKRS
jgi:dissimilatory sulfite reductase (desulfoviridin) alpha/beta subunit